MTQQTKAGTPRRGLDAIEIRSSGIHGMGAFARSSLRKGQFIGNYEGRRYGVEGEADERDDGLTYLFVLSDGGFIDGSEGGNATRHLNHSCEPNCHAQEYVDASGALGVRISTLRAIAEGEELFLDYALVVDATDDPSAYPCHCGAKTCRLTLVAPAEA